MALKKITSANSPLTLTANDFSQLVNIPYCLLVASGGGVIDITLPTIESLNKFGRVLAICEDGITTVNINVNPADAISESGSIVSSKTISGDKNFIELNATTYVNGNIWLGSTNGGSGGGGGGTVQMFAFDITIPALRVNQLLNDPSQYEIVIPTPAALNQVYEVHTCNFLLSGGATGRDGVSPQLGVYGLDNLNDAWIFATGSSAFGLNLLDRVWTSYNAALANLACVRMISNGIPLRGAILIGNYSGVSYGVTQGDSDLRVFGTYSIKQL